MEFVSPMKSILQQYQALNADLQEGLLVIIYRSLSVDHQQSILAQLIKLEIEHDEEAHTEQFETSFIIKIFKVCHCLMLENKLNIMERFLDSLISDSPVLQCTSPVLQRGESTDSLQECDDAPNVMKNTSEHTSDVLQEATAQQNSHENVRTVEQNITENNASDTFIKQLNDANSGMVMDNLVASCNRPSAENEERGLKTRKRKYAKGSQTLNHKCKPCDYVFSNRFSLYRHLIKHEEKAGGVFCNYCKRNNWFETAKQMVEHQKKSHPYISKCPQCPMSFVSEAALAKHELSHSRQSRYVLCNYCGDAFSQMCNAKSHIKVHHSDPNPYKCRICSRCYPDPQGLYHHEKTVHPEKKPYVCMLCEESFVSRRDRQKHWTGQHDITTVLVTGESPSILEENLEDEFWNETEELSQ